MSRDPAAGGAPDALLAQAGVVVRAGALGELPSQLPAAAQRFVVTDRNVAPLLPASLASWPRHVLEPGETSKSWETLGALLLALDRAGLDRDGQLVAVGGGVVTDLAGMAASLHRRGMPWVAVPTSLVGQVDAAVGGKTAVNLGGGKNTVGTFHPPACVVVDPRALATLPARHLRAGLAEVLKTALIAGGALWEQTLALDPDELPAGDERACATITGCLAVKLALVAGDLHDRGPRRLLNLGHTFGHALEALAMPALLHGEAVGLGLLCAARLAATRLPGADRALEPTLRATLARWGLPVTCDLGPEEVLHEMRRDKKRKDGALTLVLPAGAGRVQIVEGVEAEAVRAALDAVRA